MDKKQNHRLLFSIIGSLIAAIVVISIYIVYLIFSTPQTVYAPDYLLDDDGITEIEPALTMPDFTLTDQHSEAIQLSDLDGSLTLMTFGFTHCPDVCPITLGEMQKIREDLGNQADNLDYVFVSVDGERDTPDVLATYFTTMRVGDFIIGMTGNESTLRTISEPFGVEFILNEPDRSGNYTVDHTAGMFLLDENHNWIRRYRYAVQSNLIADDIRQILEN